MSNLWILGGLAPALYTAYALLTLARKRAQLPQVGGRGPINYLRTALRSLNHSKELIDQGWTEFGGKPFILPTLEGSRIVVGPEYMDKLRLSDDTVFNQPISLNEELQLDLTMNSDQQTIPYTLVVIKSNVTRNIGNFIPEVLEESQLALDETLTPKDGSESVSVPVFHTFTHLICRISNRAVVGTHLCRDEGYCNSVVKFAETLVPYAILLQFLPPALRSIIYWLLSRSFGGPQQASKYLIPYITQRLSDREKGQDNAENLISTYLMDTAPPKEAHSPEALSMRVLNVNFGSIHTTSIFTSHALFEIAGLSKSDIELMREEIHSALEAEGGFNKASLAKFRRIDSLLREVGRMYGLSHMGFNRLVIKETELDGIRIPPGYKISVNLKLIHRNPELYPNPNAFQPFRFMEMRDNEGSDMKHGFTNIDKDFIVFGGGRHACPGRFFAAMELKIIIAHIILNYDLSFADGKTERPENDKLGILIMPNLKAHLVFTKRKTDSATA